MISFLFTSRTNCVCARPMIFLQTKTDFLIIPVGRQFKADLIVSVWFQRHKYRPFWLFISLANVCISVRCVFCGWYRYEIRVCYKLVRSHTHHTTQSSSSSYWFVVVALLLLLLMCVWYLSACKLQYAYFFILSFFLFSSYPSIWPASH